MNELAMGKELILKRPRLLVSEGFYDKENWLRDTKVSIGRLGFFSKWFVERRLDTLVNNV